MKHTSALSAGILLLGVLGLGIYGMGRSLWLDEAWVANSIQAPSLGGMFYYPSWLQVNPPFFLLLVRGVVSLAGPSNAAFRLVPLLLAVAAAAGMLGVSRQLLPAPLAALATAIVAFDPTAIEYSRTLKPYSGEIAASALLLLAAVRYLHQPDRRRYVWLVAAVVLAMPLAYPSVFLLPGILLAVAVAGSRSRSLLLAGVAGALLVAMYWFSIRPNLSSDLRDFWVVAADHGVSTGLVVALLFCIAAAIRAGFNLARREYSPRNLTCVVCVLPCLLLAASGAIGLYPISHRTRLFALPCFVLLAMMTLEDVLNRFRIPRFRIQGGIRIAAWALTFGLAGIAVANQVIEGRDVAEEDFAGAVAFLQQHASLSDLILVHACCKEGFELYSAMDGWKPPHVIFGDTGWPCCARGKDSRPGVSTESAVFADIDAKLPRGYSGRVWLLYTTRPTHWIYTGLDEGNLWRKHVWDRGCPPGPYLAFANLAVSPMNCAAAR